MRLRFFRATLVLLLAAMGLATVPIVVAASQAPFVPPKPGPGARALREMVDFLLGDWVAEGSGGGGAAPARFSFETSLDGHLVTRRSRADYPATQDAPARHQEDVLVMYAEGGQVRADYFDNEGRVVHYTVAFAHESATLTFDSGIKEGRPRHRLVYRPLGKDRVEAVLEVAPADRPTAFVLVGKGISRRIRDSGPNPKSQFLNPKSQIPNQFPSPLSVMSVISAGLNRRIGGPQKPVPRDTSSVIPFTA